MHFLESVESDSLPQEEEEKALKGKYCTNPKAFENASKQRRRKVLVLFAGKKKK